MIHDYSKFYPDEWIPYAYFFNTLQTPEVKAAFFIAWNKHCKRNDHHWQWWVQPTDGGVIKTFEMTEAARLEMVADWLGVQATLKTPYGLEEWYSQRETGILLGPKTKSWLKRYMREL